MSRSLRPSLLPPSVPVRTCFALLGLLLAPLSQAQTLQRVELVAGTGSSNPRGFATMGDRVYFFATDANGQNNLWSTDGTRVGTALLTRLPTDLTLRSRLYAAGLSLYFTASSPAKQTYTLWRSDGTPGNAAEVPVPSAATEGTPYVSEIVATVGDRVFFTAIDARGIELWAASGATGEAQIVRDIRPGPLTSNAPTNAFALGSTLYFNADDGNGYTLWKSDGTTSGTVQMTSLYEGAGGLRGAAIPVAALGSTLFLIARTDVTGQEPFATDGTAQGTRLLRDILPGGLTSRPSSFTPLGNRVFFFATETTDPNVTPPSALWVTDGTPARTEKVSTVAASTPGPTNIVGPLVAAGNGRLFYMVRAGSFDAELWTSDGTAGGTRFVKALDVAVTGSSGRGFAAADGRVYFASPSGGPSNFWVSDGTDAGTHPLGDASTPLKISSFQFTTLGSRIVFNGSDFAEGNELWVLDTATGTAAASPSATSALAIEVRGRRLLVTGGGVRVEAYDVLGRRVATLHEGPFTERLALELPSDLASGIYLVRATDVRGNVASASVVVTR